MSLGRTLPHSLEAEEQVLSCIFLDPATLQSTISHGISQDSFYDAANGIIYATCLSLSARNVQPEIYVVAEELKATKQLDSVGGYARLVAVSGKAPTTAQAHYWIEVVKEKHTLREIIRSATSAVEESYDYSGDIDSFHAQIIAKISAATKKHSKTKTIPLTEFKLPAPDDPNVLLGDRYICRGSGTLVVSTAGMGKSSMSLQAVVLLALEKAWFGIKGKRPLKSIIFQSEDDEGDIAAVWHSLKYALKLTDEELDYVRQRVAIVTERVKRGQTFLLWMKGVCEEFKPDLVWINPLHAFFDGDIKDAGEVGHFLREGLNKANPDNYWAYMIVHHTAKPSAPSEKKGERAWNEEMYEMAGSAELINWARAVIIIKPTKTEGQFNLVLAKRGKQAGVTQPTDDGRWEIVTRIPIAHSKEHFVGEDGNTHKLIFWVNSDAAPAEQPAESAKPRGRPQKEHDPAELRRILFHFPVSSGETIGFNRLKVELSMASGTLSRTAAKLIEERYISMEEDGGYKRTPKGDAKFKSLSEAQP